MTSIWIRKILKYFIFQKEKNQNHTLPCDEFEWNIFELLILKKFVWNMKIWIECGRLWFAIIQLRKWRDFIFYAFSQSTNDFRYWPKTGSGTGSIRLTGSYLEWDFFVWQLIFFLWFQSVLASVCRCNHIEVYHIVVRHFQNPFALITHQEQPGSMNFSFYRFLSKNIDINTEM